MANYTLTAAINGATTPIGVTPAYALTGSGYPGRLSCESETMYVTGGDGTTEISVIRGQDGTDAVAQPQWPHLPEPPDLRPRRRRRPVERHRHGEGERVTTLIATLS